MVVLGFFLFNPNAWAIEIGEVPPKPWSSEELQGKVHVLFYVDPDEKDTNNETTEALNKENFPQEKCHYFGVINMAATWMPNFAINMALKEKQERYPKTTYLRDNKKVLVNNWKIADDSSVALVFDKKGKLIFKKEGKLKESEIQRLIRVVRENL
jgi:YtfJ family uncharacterized protein